MACMSLYSIGSAQLSPFVASAFAEQSQTLNVVHYTIPSGGQVLQIVAGPDGNLWFTIDKTGQRGTFNGQVLNPVVASIGRVTPAGIVTEFPIPGSIYNYVASMPGDNSFAITVGSDGNLWFTEAEANKIGKITPQGVITEYQLPEIGMPPRSITSGPDGNLWFMGSGPQGSKLMSMSLEGAIVKQFSISGYNLGSTMTTGPDGNLWFGGAGYYNVARVTTDGVVTEFATSGRPINIVPGTNNDLWFAQNGGHLSRVTTSGVITEYVTIGDQAWALAMSPDNNIWFRDTTENNINKHSPTHEVTKYLLSGQGYEGDMVFGPDGNIWFAGNGTVGRIEIVVPAPTPTQASTPTGEEPTPTVEPAGATPSPVVEVTPTPSILPEDPTPTQGPVVEPTPTEAPVVNPTVMPNPTSAPAEEEQGEVTPTPTEVPHGGSQEIVVTPVPTSGSSASSRSVGGDGLSDGRSDGRSDGMSNRNPAPTGVAVSNQQLKAVLGATTMAKTGTLEQRFMIISGIFGMLLLMVGSLVYVRQNKV